MEHNGFLLFAAVWLLLLMTRLGRRSSRPSPPREPRAPDLRPSITSRDPSQREGSRIEAMLREFQRTLENAKEQGRLKTTQSRYSRPESGLVERDEAASLESPVLRPGRKSVDQDDEAEEIVARRINEASARDQSRSVANRAGVDERIQQQPADNTRVRTYTPRQLRDAMVWREILNPPVSLRPESEPNSLP